MKISDYVMALQAIELEHGDLEVVGMTDICTVLRKIGFPELSYVSGNFFCEYSKNGEKVCRL